MRLTALVVALALVTGCVGYSPSAKRWSYAGNTVLMLGGGAAIAGGVLADDEMCTGTGCPRTEPPISGTLVAGVLLATMGLVGILVTATRPVPKSTSR